MRTKVKLITGIVVCCCAAILLSWVMKDPDTRLAAPLLCIFVVFLVAFRWGRAAAILGAAAANLIFAMFLFPPVGSIRISELDERMALVVLQSSAVFAALLIGPHRKKDPPE